MRPLGLTTACLVLLCGLLGPSAVSGPAAARGVDVTCALALSRTDPATVNVAFPDRGAEYYTVPFAVVPGMRLRITGQFPHARYVSYNVYDPALRPFAALADVDLAPDRGSVNPFRPTARRDAPRRRYTAYVEFSEPPAHPAPNTLYAGAGQDGRPNPTGWLIYRIYVPDKGAGATGGVPIPTVTLEQAGGGNARDRSTCDEVSKPSVLAANRLVATSGGLAGLDGAQPWGRPVPPWARFVNLPTSAADFFLNNPSGEEARPAVDPLVASGGEGGFLSNLHNAYLTTAVNRAYGQVVVTRFRAPTFPDTRRGAKRMPGRAQVRYWSICQNEFFSQRFIACRADDQAVVDRRGFVTVVVSTPQQRPRTATRRCGVTWLPWGPYAEGVLIYRHMLPAASFDQAVQNAAYHQERRTMASYLPRSTYYPDAAAFDAERNTPC